MKKKVHTIHVSTVEVQLILNALNFAHDDDDDKYLNHLTNILHDELMSILNLEVERKEKR